MSLDRSARRAATSRFSLARAEEPHPLFAVGNEVVAYIRGIQEADRELAAALRDGQAESEREMLRRRRQSADVSVARQMGLLARRMNKERHASIETFNAVYRLGSAPTTSLHGPYKGQLVTTTLTGPLDTYVRFAQQLYMVWLGKRFDSERERGDNVFRPGMRVWGRLLWPLYPYKPYKGGLVTGLDFRTYLGPGALDPDTLALKLDYDLPGNPGLLVRSVLDELVQITGNYYLGKAYIRRSGGRLRLAAFFALQKEK